MTREPFNWRGIWFEHAPGTNGHFRVRGGALRAYVNVYADHACADISSCEGKGRDAIAALDAARLKIENLARLIGILDPPATPEPVIPKPSAKTINWAREDMTKRQPGCLCQLEEGDSPCPLHSAAEDAPEPVTPEKST